MSNKFICDGCNRVFPRSEIGGERKVKLSGNGNYAGNIITLLFCKDCWKERAEKKGNDDGKA